MKVIHCAETIKGGIATYFNELIPLQHEFYGPNSIWIVIPKSQLNQLEGIKSNCIVTYNDFKSRLLNAFLLAFVVFKLAFKNKVNLIHVHSTFAGLGVRVLNTLLFMRFKIIYCPHGWAWDIKAGGIFKGIIKNVEWLLSKVTNTIICISDHERLSAINNSIHSSKLHIIKNGLSLNRPPAIPIDLNIPQGVRKILFVGRFDRQKGTDVFISAITELGDSVHGIMAGGTVISKNEILHLPENISNVGWVNKNQLEYLFNLADVVVIPSRWEGFGLVALEAMRAGLPVIATKVGGLKEIVLDKKTGVLIEPDSVYELKSSLMALTKDDLINMGQAGHYRMRDMFAVDRVFKEIGIIYNSLMIHN